MSRTSEAECSATTREMALERRITLRIPLAWITSEQANLVRHYARTAKLPGFRPGKVPMKVVERLYGAEAYREAMERAIKRAFHKAVSDGSFRVAGSVRFEHNLNEKEERPEGEVLVDAIFEVFPEIEIKSLKGVEIVKPLIFVDEEAVDKTIQHIQKRMVSYVPVERPVAQDDRVTFDLIAKKDADILPSLGGRDLIMVAGGGAQHPDLDKAAMGMQPGETKEVVITYPEDYPVSEIAGQSLRWTLTIKKVEEPRLPSIDAEFARLLGIEDGDLLKLRKEVRRILEREVRNRVDNEVKRQVFEVLLANHSFPIPTSLVAEELQAIRQRMSKELAIRGLNLDVIQTDDSWFREEAERRVRLGLLLGEIVRQNKLEATPEAVRKMIEDLADDYDDPKTFVRWYYEKPERLRDIEAIVVEKNVVNWALQQLTVREEPRRFDELMQFN